MTKSFGKSKSNWTARGKAIQQRKRVSENLRRGEKSRALMKARITALVAKVSLLESELASIFEFLGIPDVKNNTTEQKEIQQKLLSTSEKLAKEE